MHTEDIAPGGRLVGRFWNLSQTAKYLGKSPAWLKKHSAKLEKEGFPKNDPDLGGRDSKAIIKFLDHRCGLDQKSPPQADLLQIRAKAIANDERK
ncbi:hypothetical protein [Magnetovibrio blakemorei]|uniref:hypothetical protein n=1 Tax=Magnetovibrio blakemorei TaxID=28181 RepID=UPI001112CED6|nr:hypothetical protein [Magnetovibrio blakemorei]